MGNTLFDQLKKSGLIDGKKARQSKKEKHDLAKQKKGKNAKTLSESKQRVQQALTQKSARDRELNKKRKQATEQKAVAAQIKQLIELNRFEDTTGDIGFNFTDGTTIQRIFVTSQLQAQLATGFLAIVKLGSQYSLVPSEVAEKIKLRDPAYIIVLNSSSTETNNPDDPYADFKVPDDLIW